MWTELLTFSSQSWRLSFFDGNFQVFWITYTPVIRKEVVEGIAYGVSTPPIPTGLWKNLTKKDDLQKLRELCLHILTSLSFLFKLGNRFLVLYRGNSNLVEQTLRRLLSIPNFLQVNGSCVEEALPFPLQMMAIGKHHRMPLRWREWRSEICGSNTVSNHHLEALAYRCTTVCA